MRISQGLQPNHSEYMRLVATLDDEKSARTTYEDLLRHLEELFDRADKFDCAGFGRNFETEEEFQAWKKKEWDPVADSRCKLTIDRRDGRIYVSGGYGLILDDWARDDTAIALDGKVIALTVYTAGYGLDYLQEWFLDHGGSSEVSVQGEEYEYRDLETALEELKAQAGKPGTSGLRAEDSHDDSI